MQCKIFVGWTLPKLEIYKQSFKTACCSSLNYEIATWEFWVNSHDIFTCAIENKAIWFSTALSHIILFMAERIYAHSTYIYVSTTCMTRISSPNILVYFWFEKNDTCISKQQHTNCLDVQDFFLVLLHQASLKEKLFALNVYFWH